MSKYRNKASMEPEWPSQSSELGLKPARAIDVHPCSALAPIPTPYPLTKFRPYSLHLPRPTLTCKGVTRGKRNLEADFHRASCNNAFPLQSLMLVLWKRSANSMSRLMKLPSRRRATWFWPRHIKKVMLKTLANA